MTRITQQQLESYLWGAAVLLRGTIDAGDYKQFIFPLLFFKRLCDVFDEETFTALRESVGDQQRRGLLTEPRGFIFRWGDPSGGIFGWSDLLNLGKL